VAAIQPDTTARYRLRSRQMLRAQMYFRNMNVRKLAMACGNPGLRSSIGNLVSGARVTTNATVARALEDVLYPGSAEGTLFEPVICNRNTATVPELPRGRRAA
jgi:hypothetical protein